MEKKKVKGEVWILHLICFKWQRFEMKLRNCSVYLCRREFDLYEFFDDDLDGTVVGDPGYFS